MTDTVGPMRWWLIGSLLLGCQKPAPPRPSQSPAAVNAQIAAAARFRDVVVPPPPDVVQPARVVAPDTGPPKRPPRPRAPSPIRPRRSSGQGHSLDPQSPCVTLVDRVCDMLTIASDECADARARLALGPSVVDADRCTEALDFVRERIDLNPRQKPCTLLQDLRCAGFRSRSPTCKKERKLVQQLTKMMPEACLSEILLERGLPRVRPEVKTR